MRAAISVLTILLLGMGGFAFASPYIALNGLRSALDTGDSEEISNRVDFPLLRQNMKSQLLGVLEKEVGTASEDNPFAALASGVASVMVDETLDALVTPAGIARLVAGDRAIAARGPGDEQSQSTRRNLLNEARIVHESLDRVSVFVPNDFGNEIRIVMDRDGLTWKLTNVVIPGLGR